MPARLRGQDIEVSVGVEITGFEELGIERYRQFEGRKVKRCSRIMSCSPKAVSSGFVGIDRKGIAGIENQFTYSVFRPADDEIRDAIGVEISLGRTEWMHRPMFDVSRREFEELEFDLRQHPFPGSFFVGMDRSAGPGNRCYAEEGRGYQLEKRRRRTNTKT